MSWTTNNIANRAFTPAEHESLGKKSNPYNTFVQVAFRSYNQMSVKEKEDVVEDIMGVRMYITDVVTKVIVNRQ